MRDSVSWFAFQIPFYFNVIPPRENHLDVDVIFFICEWNIPCSECMWRGDVFKMAVCIYRVVLSVYAHSYDLFSQIPPRLRGPRFTVESEKEKKENMKQRLNVCHCFPCYYSNEVNAFSVFQKCPHSLSRSSFAEPSKSKPLNLACAGWRHFYRIVQRMDFFMLSFYGVHEKKKRVSVFVSCCADRLTQTAGRERGGEDERG